MVGVCGVVVQQGANHVHIVHPFSFCEGTGGIELPRPVGVFFSCPMSEEPVAKRQKVGHMLNIADCVDKASEGLPFSVLKVSKLSVLQGLAEHANDMMTAFGLYTVEEFAAWRFGRWAQALVTMADCEVEGKRPLDAKLNIDLALDKVHVFSSPVCPASPCPAALTCCTWK